MCDAGEDQEEIEKQKQHWECHTQFKKETEYISYVCQDQFTHI